MHISKEKIPVMLEAPGAVLRSENWDGMRAATVKLSKGADFTPVLKGLKDDLCPCPHWGYMIKGSVQVRYTDGGEETFHAGDVWYLPPGHTLWCEEDAEYVDFSPAEDFERVIEHIREQIPG